MSSQRWEQFYECRRQESLVRLHSLPGAEHLTDEEREHVLESGCGPSDLGFCWRRLGHEGSHWPHQNKPCPNHLQIDEPGPEPGVVHQYRVIVRGENGPIVTTIPVSADAWARALECAGETGTVQWQRTRTWREVPPEGE